MKTEAEIHQALVDSGLIKPEVNLRQVQDLCKFLSDSLRDSIKKFGILPEKYQGDNYKRFFEELKK